MTSRARNWLPWAVAIPLLVLPLVWTLAWASRVPEPVAWRLRLQESPSVHTWADLGDFGEGPAHWLARVLHRLAVTAAGGDLGLAALANWGAGVVITLLLVRLLRRVGLIAPGFSGLAAAVLALAVFSPAYAGAWLLGERVGAFAATACLLVGLHALCGRRPGGGCLLLATGAAFLAPFCHMHGAAVWLALAFPVLRWCRRSGQPNGFGALACVAVAGILATVSAAPPTHTASGVLAMLLAAPGATVLALLRATGERLPDLLPNLNADAMAAGVLAWLCVLMGPFAVRAPTAPGLVPTCHALVAWPVFAAVLDAERWGSLELPAAAMRELGPGGALLAPGMVGVFVACLSRSVLTALVAGAVVLGVQDWHRGFEVLKLQAAVLRRGEAAVAVAEHLANDVPVPVGNVQAIPALRSLGLLPRLPAVTSLAPPPSHALPVGTLVRIDGDQVVGTVHATRWRAAPDLVFLLADEPTARVIAVALPEFESGGKIVAFRLTVPVGAMPAGRRHRVVGFSVRSQQLQPLPGRVVVANGRIELERDDG
ncbi:MAG: hypothetical protein IPK26_29915 [Planctomycetes bacterium]|nr:hypothetical protein [Planctomycetota bacterium]